MKESDIVKSILKQLKTMDVFAWKHWGGPMSKKGVSDILGVLPGGRALAIEVKNCNGKVTENQRQFLEDVARAGGLSFIARSVEDVRHELEKVGIVPPQGMLF